MKPTATVIKFNNRAVPRKLETSTGQLSYGLNDLLPNDEVRMINESGVAKACVKRKGSFIQADGFSSEAAAKFKIIVGGKEVTANHLLSQIAKQWAYFEGLSLFIDRNVDAKVIGAHVASFDCVRKLENGNFNFNKLKGQKDFKKEETKIHPAYKQNLTPQELEQQLADFDRRPEILYSYIESPDNPDYPVTTYYAGIEDIQTSSELAKFDLETVLNGFITSGILSIVGEMDDQVKREDGLTDLERFQEQLSTFTGGVKDENGLSGRNRLLLLFAQTKDALAQLQPFDSKAIYDASNTKRTLIEQCVCRLFGIHPVLMGYEAATVLGNTQALSNAIALLNIEVNEAQRHISEVFAMLFGDAIDWTITTFNPLKYIPNEVLAVLSTDEKRALGGYAPAVTLTPAQP